LNKFDRGCSVPHRFDSHSYTWPNFKGDRLCCCLEFEIYVNKQSRQIFDKKNISLFFSIKSNENTCSSSLVIPWRIKSSSRNDVVDDEDDEKIFGHKPKLLPIRVQVINVRGFFVISFKSFKYSGWPLRIFGRRYWRKDKDCHWWLREKSVNYFS